MADRDCNTQDALLSKEDIVGASQKLGNCVGVYFLVKDGEITYVGKTVNIHQRLGTHFCDKDFESYYFIPANNISAAERLESLYIKKFLPKANKVYGINWGKKVTDPEISKAETAFNLLRAGVCRKDAAEQAKMPLEKLNAMIRHREKEYGHKYGS